MKLDPVLSDRILDAVRPHLPESTTIRRRRRGVPVTRTRKKRFDTTTSSSGSFGHLSRRNTRVHATELALVEVLRDISRHLRVSELRWPGLAWGPVEVSASILGSDVHAEIEDEDGTVVSVTSVSSL
jgi:hypothetical protein